jgi:hypothetical protein
VIIRILSERQYLVPDQELDRLNALDRHLQAAADREDEAGFTVALADLLAEVRTTGAAVPDDTLTSSDLVLPAEGSSLAEVGAILGDEGLIPDY